MSLMIIAALLLTLLQLVLLPELLGIKNLKYMISSRDEPLAQTQLQQRTDRAAGNLQESLPAFLALCLLAMVQNIDLTQAATAWLVLRAIYIPCYMFGIIYVRTLVWIGSLCCLIYMGAQLV